MSWQMRVLNAISRSVVKPAVKRASAQATVGEEYATIQKLRGWVANMDAFLTRRDTAPSVAVEPVADHPDYLWVNNEAGVRRTILYLHGGGMVVHVPGLYTQWAQRLAAATDARVLLIDYRLAPEHPYPASNEDCLEAYRWLLEDQGAASERLVIAGDSAGGYLTLTTLLRIQEAGLARPACAIAFSPLADFSLGSDSIFRNESADPLLSNRLLPLVRKLVLGGHAATDPLVSPVYADLRNFPPLQVHVSSNEIIRDDGLRIAQRAQAQGVISEMYHWHKTTHVHPLFKQLPESQWAMEKVVRFIDRYAAPVA